MVKSFPKKEINFGKAFCIEKDGKGQNKIVIVLLYVKTFRLEEEKFEYVGT
jgi:hypothetical protein